MSKPNILIQLDTAERPSVFDAVVAVDSGVDHLLQYGGATPENVRELVHGAIFTRGPDDLKHTAIFVGGSNVAAGEKLLAAVRDAFFGPMRVSVLLDANGANTTAAAAVLAASKHVPLAGATAVVLAATGPVGNRAVRLLAREGAAVRAASRDRARSEAVCAAIKSALSSADVSPWQTASPAELATALDGADILIAAGAAGVQLVSAATLKAAESVRVAIDLNAVPPLGIGGIKATDKAADREGKVAYGALGVGGTKMKIHKEAIRRLFTANDQILDAEEILQIGKQLG
ncbi:MAG: bifunctional NADP-dependent methylenetetrahydromethanopterin dehydrogenase/methylenetetrahydrofolate dehydrogenase [Planctomycetota bacterium]|nr:MAG: bifunctional NADP-dependent methylenetetrahydromethanopterin dehydrogenase/methylenetetrahydrofolate dehydrogenase [Planctomycetota bacterium]